MGRAVVRRIDVDFVLSFLIGKYLSDRNSTGFGNMEMKHCVFSWSFKFSCIGIAPWLR